MRLWLLPVGTTLRHQKLAFQFTCRYALMVTEASLISNHGSLMMNDWIHDGGNWGRTNRQPNGQQLWPRQHTNTWTSERPNIVPNWIDEHPHKYNRVRHAIMCNRPQWPPKKPPAAV